MGDSRLLVCFDGGARANGTAFAVAGAGAVMYRDGVKVSEVILPLPTVRSNNVAEYEAVLAGLHLLNEANDADGTQCTIVSFTSFCGGLPAPQSNNNPFGYKFSWAPRGVLLAARNNSKYLQDGEVKDVPGEKLWSVAQKMEVRGFDKPFEGVPNRDSTQYKQIYDLPDIQTLLRGTFRYAGWADILLSLAKMNMLDLEERDLNSTTYNQLMLQQSGGAAGANPKESVSKFVGHPVDGDVIKAMEWLGLFTDDKIEAKTYLDSVCELMKKKPSMYYAEGEKDMIVMKHTYQVEYPDRTEYLSTQLVDYALEDGTTSMSRTVGIPVAVATRMVLEGKITGSGIKIPIVADIYEPILELLAKEGIVFEDTLDKVVKKTQ
ncbi:Saccharopine dehydrogenase [Diplonema papillatum]|nr:Saccharopine dehydrogenase [Diplonema papillatum]